MCFIIQAATMASAESQAIQKYFATLVTAINSPLAVAVEAYSRELISSDVRDKMVVLGMTEKDKTAILMSAIEHSINTRPHLFHEFVRVLKTQPYLEQVAEELQMEFRKFCCDLA